MITDIELENRIGVLSPARSFQLNISSPSNIALERVGGFTYLEGAIIIRITKNTFKAFSYVCTHNGCILGYDKNTNALVCPCQCGIYDLEGNVIRGMPVKPLRQFTVQREGDVLTITDNYGDNTDICNETKW